MADVITDDLADFFVDTIAHEALSGTDGFGDPSYADSVDLSGRTFGGGERMNDDDGQEFVTKGGVVFATAATVQPGDRLTLPADFDDRVVIVRKHYHVRDENGHHHTKAWY